VVRGTPTTFATPRPMSIIATAQVRRSLLTRLAATTDPMPKKAPWGMPERNRAPMSCPYVVGKPEATFATAKPTMRARRTALRGTFAASTAMSGAPTTTPRAYAETKCPAVGMSVPMPFATCGSRPMVTNSVVPMAKPPMASASSARPTCRVIGATPLASTSWDGGVVVVSVIGRAVPFRACG